MNYELALLGRRAAKRELPIEHDVTWEAIEPRIQADIDATIDYTQFVWRNQIPG